MRTLIASLLLAGSTCAYTVDRRSVVQSLTTAGVSAASAWGSPPPAEAVLSSKYCASGVGEGCTDLSEGNDLIRSLQEKSATNRERNEKVRATCGSADGSNTNRDILRISRIGIHLSLPWFVSLITGSS